MTIEKYEIDRRSQEQFQLFKLNIIAAGAIATYALSDKGDHNALLIIPWLSFAMFVYWVYQGVSIRSADRKSASNREFWEWVRRFFAFVARMMNFALLPWGAIQIHKGEEYLKFKEITSILPWISIILYLIWFIYQYLIVFPPQEYEE
jgi:fatty acid desaturase